MASATITLEALFRTADGSDVEIRKHEVDVTDTRAELLKGGDEFTSARVDEDLVDGAAFKLGWDGEPNFIEWRVARVVIA